MDEKNRKTMPVTSKVVMWAALSFSSLSTAAAPNVPPPGPTPTCLDGLIRGGGGSILHFTLSTGFCDLVLVRYDFKTVAKVVSRERD